MEEQHKLAVWSLVDAFNNTQNRPIRTQQVSYIREFSSFIRSKYSTLVGNILLVVGSIQREERHERHVHVT